MPRRKPLGPVPGMDRKLAVVSDIHAGSTTAVCAAPVQLDDGQTVHPSEVQRWLAELWEEYWSWGNERRGAWLRSNRVRSWVNRPTIWSRSGSLRLDVPTDRVPPCVGSVYLLD